MPGFSDIKLILSILDAANTNVAIVLDRLGVKPDELVYKGRLQKGYGLKKDGSLLFKLPKDYDEKYNLYTFNLARNIFLIFLIIILLFF